jgi:hypothetical protein
VLFTRKKIDDVLEDVLEYKLDKLKKIDYIRAVSSLYIPTEYMSYGSFKKFDYVVVEEGFVEDKFKVNEIFNKHGYRLDKQIGVYSIYARD